MGAERLSARSGHSANRKTTGTTQQAREMPIPESTLSRWSHHQAGTAFKQAHVPIREALAAYNWPSDVKYDCFQPPPGQSAAAPRPWRGSQHQILQALHQVVGDVDLAAPFHLVPRHLRPQADDWRVRGAEGQALRHPQPGPEHDPHGHPHRVDGVCGYQRRGLLKSEVVGGFWGFLAMPPPIRGDCSNQSARRGRPGAMSPESAGGLGSWLVSEMPDFRNQCWSEHHPMVWCIGKVSLGVGRRWQFRQHFR